MCKTLCVIIVFAASILFSGEGVSDDSVDFITLVNKLEHHSKVKSLNAKTGSIREIAQYNSSWTNPAFRLDALNFPITDPTFGQSPMSGISFTLSQTFPLTGRLGKIKKAGFAKANASEQQKESFIRLLQRDLWRHLIWLYRAGAEQSILNENISWLTQMVEVTSKRYSTGQSRQEALLGLLVRKSETETLAKSKSIQIEKLWRSLARTIDEPNRDIRLNHASIPWAWLREREVTVGEIKPLPVENALNRKKEGIEFNIAASKREWVPDLTVGLNYRYRRSAGSDTGGDFVGGFVSFPLPLFKRPTAKISSYSFDLQAVGSDLESIRRRQIGNISVENKKLEELRKRYEILTEDTLPLAETQREATSVNYRVGMADYVSLLKSQLELQRLRLEEVSLEAAIRETKVELIYESGHPMIPLPEEKEVKQ